MACKHRDLDEKFIGNPGELPMDPLWIEANMLNLGTGNFCFFFLENGENHPAKGVLHLESYWTHHRASDIPCYPTGDHFPNRNSRCWEISHPKELLDVSP